MNIWKQFPLTSILLLVLFTAPRATATEQTFYVSPQGNDSWSGTLAAPNADQNDGPWATLAGARDGVRKYQEGRSKEAAKLPQSLVVLIRQGTYRLTGPLRFSPQDSGTRETPITYRAYPHEQPVLDGGRPITGWRQEGPLWVTEIADVQAGNWRFSSLWANGRRCQPARTPNPAHPWGDDPAPGDTFHAVGPVPEAPVPESTASETSTPEKSKTKGKRPNSKTRFRYRPEDLGNFKSLDDAVVVVYHSWATSLLRIKGLDKKNRIVEFTGPARWPFGKWQPDQRYYIEQTLAALDAPGEWYLNRKTGRLSYWPREGEVLGQTRIVAPVAGQLLLLEGSPSQDQFVEHLSWEGLTFRHTEYPIGPKGHSDSQAAFAVSAAIETNGARHCNFRDCTLAALGNHAIWFRSGSQDCSIARCELVDLGAGGVRIGEGRSPRTGQEAVLRNVVDNCFIHEGGRIFRSAVGVWIGRASDNRVTHNEIRNFRYTGVSVGWSWGYAPSSAKGNLIAANHIHHIGLGQLNDMGGIYTLGISPGTVLRDNVIHDVISHPRLYGGWGLYTDEGSTDILLENNLVYNTTTGGFHQHYGRDNRVVNNIFAFSHGPQIIRSREEPHNSFFFERNIVYYDNGQLLGSTWKNGNWTIDHNCYWDTSGKPLKLAGRTWQQWQAEGHDKHSRVADPRFVAPKQGDFHLQKDSPALSLGFVPWEYDQAGLIGEPEWVKRAK